MDVLDVVMRRRRDLTNIGNLAAQPVDVLHGEHHARLVGDGEQVEHRVGRAAHGDVERHGVLECLTRGDRPRQDRFVPIFVV